MALSYPGYEFGRSTGPELIWTGYSKTSLAVARACRSKAWKHRNYSRLERPCCTGWRRSTDMRISLKSAKV
jgi:hypothetical protein